MAHANSAVNRLDLRKMGTNVKPTNAKQALEFLMMVLVIHKIRSNVMKDKLLTIKESVKTVRPIPDHQKTEEHAYLNNVQGTKKCWKMEHANIANLSPEYLTMAKSASKTSVTTIKSFNLMEPAKTVSMALLQLVVATTVKHKTEIMVQNSTTLSWKSMQKTL